jgi:hypothetical protein
MLCVNAEIHSKALIEDSPLSHKSCGQSGYFNHWELIVIYANRMICFNYSEPMLFEICACEVGYFQLC